MVDSPIVDAPVNLTVVSALAVQISEALPIRPADVREPRVFVDALGIAERGFASEQARQFEFRARLCPSGHWNCADTRKNRY